MKETASREGNELETRAVAIVVCKDGTSFEADWSYDEKAWIWRTDVVRQPANTERKGPNG